MNVPIGSVQITRKEVESYFLGRVPQATFETLMMVIMDGRDAIPLTALLDRIQYNTERRIKELEVSIHGS